MSPAPDLTEARTVRDLGVALDADGDGQSLPRGLAMTTTDEIERSTRSPATRRTFASDDERIASFGRAMDALRDEVEATVGEEDVKHLRHMRALSSKLEIAGRTLLVLGVGPLTYGLGLVALFGHKQLEAIEIGHSVLHGAYDRLAIDEEFRSDRFRWKLCVDETSWRIEHNVRHHQYTNVLGKDPDLRLGPVRLSARIPFSARHRLQPYSALVTWPFFDLAIHLHATGMLDLYFHGLGVPGVLRDLAPETVARAKRAAIDKFARYYAREFVLVPALAGPFFAKVLVGNLLTELARNVYTAMTIYCGHVGARDYAEGTRPHGRAEWYVMQVEAAHDFEVSLPLSILCGALDRQIEHHCFPRLPPNRLREIAPRLRAICEEHGVTYRTAGWPTTLVRALSHLRTLAAPDVRAMTWA